MACHVEIVRAARGECGVLALLRRFYGSGGITNRPGFLVVANRKFGSKFGYIKKKPYLCGEMLLFMDYGKMKEDMRRVADLQPSQVTDADKELVRLMAEELGLNLKAPRTRCKTYYVDIAVLVYREAARLEAVENSKTDTRRYVLVPGTDVYFGSKRINEATITDELAESIIARGFDKSYFAKC